MSRRNTLPGIDPENVSSVTGFPISMGTLQRLVREGTLRPASLGTEAISKASLQAFVQQMDARELSRFRARELIAWAEENGVDDLSAENRAHLIAHALKDFDAVKDILTGAVEART